MIAFEGAKLTFRAFTLGLVSLGPNGDAGSSEEIVRDPGWFAFGYWEAEVGPISGFGQSWELWAQSRSRGIAVFGVGKNIWVRGL